MTMCRNASAPRAPARRRRASALLRSCSRVAMRSATVAIAAATTDGARSLTSGAARPRARLAPRRRRANRAHRPRLAARRSTLRTAGGKCAVAPFGRRPAAPVHLSKDSPAARALASCSRSSTANRRLARRARRGNGRLLRDARRVALLCRSRHVRVGCQSTTRAGRAGLRAAGRLRRARTRTEARVKGSFDLLVPESSLPDGNRRRSLSSRAAHDGRRPRARTAPGPLLRAHRRGHGPSARVSVCSSFASADAAVPPRRPEPGRQPRERRAAEAEQDRTTLQNRRIVISEA